MLSCPWIGVFGHYRYMAPPVTLFSPRIQWIDGAHSVGAWVGDDAGAERAR